MIAKSNYTCYVIDKVTKLETIYNRIHEIKTRVKVLHRDKIIIYLNNIISGKNEKEEKEKLELEHNNLYKEFEVLNLLILDLNI